MYDALINNNNSKNEVATIHLLKYPTTSYFDGFDTKIIHLLYNIMDNKKLP